MIDLTSLKAPGWDRVVAELSSPANDDRSYLERLTRVIGQVSAARQAALFIPGMSGGSSGELSARLLQVWPLPAGSEPDTKTFPVESLEQGAETKAAAVGAIESGQSRAFGLDAKDGLYDGGAGKGCVLAVPVLGEGGRAAAVVTLLIESRSKAAVQSTLAMAEVLAGYVTLHAGRQEIKRMQQAGLSMELATRLIGAINAAPNFKGASLRLVNDLTRQLGADRAALGWVGGAGGDSIKVVALSDSEKFDTRTKMVRQIADAMDECADQEQAVLFPPPTVKGDVLLAQAVTTAHRELAAGDARLSLCSVPLRDGDSTLGVLLVELKRKDDKGGDAGLDLRGVEVLQAAMDLVTPVLAVKWSDSRLLPRRALGDAKRALAWAVGTKHTVWKGVGVLVLVAALFVTFFKIEHRVGATVELRPRMQRTVSAPFEGVVLRLGEGVEPGRIVKKGDLIVEMDTRELVLQRDQAEAKIQQGTKQLSAARRDGKVVEAQMAETAIAKAEAERSLASVRIGLARLTAPMDGVVIAGDMRDKVGAAVKSGEEMFLVAPAGDLVAVARVDERDIVLVKEGARGEIATRARPSEGFGVTVETVIPMAMPRDGKNVFEVRAKLDGGDAPPPAWLRPGMEGEIRIDAGRRSLLWIGTRRVVDQIRLWLW